MSEEGLSKGQQKKMQKKAEKAQAKNNHKVTTPPPIVEAPPLETPVFVPKWTLLNASMDDNASLKVLWTAQHYQVPLVSGVAATSRRAVLQYGTETVFGGGNAMAQAIAFSASKTTFPEQMMIEEWLEWERTVLRVDPVTGLAHLAQSLPRPQLVGSSLTVADICILTTLSTMDAASFPPEVKQYVQIHQSALTTAQKALACFEPRLSKVVDLIFDKIIRNLFGNDISLPGNITQPCQNTQHGDFQCNAAMPTFAFLKKQGSSEYKSPQDVAQAIVQSVGSEHPILMDLQVNGPGFVLCRLKPAYLEQHINGWLSAGKLPFPPISQNEICVVDFSSPNIAKEMHVGHLRSTIIGESVCRVLEAAGHYVHRVNHVGDWGTQFGMLIQYLKEEYPHVIAQEDGALPNISDLTEFYKNAKARFDADADFKKTSQTNVVELQSGDPQCLKIWKMLCDVSRLEFEKVYQRLDVNVKECGESFYNPKIPAVIEEFDKAGRLSIEEGGAKCVFVEGMKVPLMLQKSDGGYGYDSTDMAALKYRLFELKADRIIAITDLGQNDHFKLVFAGGKEIGWLKGGQRLKHIGFGTVNGEDGKRFKTRSGETVRLVDLLDESVSRMESKLRERIQEGKANITEEEVHEVAEAIGYGAVKYYDLRRNPTSSYKFSYDEMLSTSGDTAVYLLYARVRLESIAAKAHAEFNVDVEDLLRNHHPVKITHPSERNLVLHLQKYADVMEQTLDDLYPYHICDYVYKLANAASEFVTKCRVLGDPEMSNRLLLCHATTLAMHQCFDLLGIRHIKRI